MVSSDFLMHPYFCPVVCFFDASVFFARFCDFLRRSVLYWTLQRTYCSMHVLPASVLFLPVSVLFCILQKKDWMYTYTTCHKKNSVCLLSCEVPFPVRFPHKKLSFSYFWCFVLMGMSNGEDLELDCPTSRTRKTNTWKTNTHTGEFEL